MTNLPESNFKFRRIYSYALTLILSGLIGLTVWQMEASDDLRTTAFWLIIALIITNTYYMVAPTAEQIPRILQAARLKLFDRGRSKAAPPASRVDDPE